MMTMQSRNACASAWLLVGRKNGNGIGGGGMGWRQHVATSSVWLTVCRPIEARRILRPSSLECDYGRLDRMPPRDQHRFVMRHLWFALLLVVSLALSATASAWAAQACPYKQAAVSAAAHDCCPGQQTKPKPADNHHKTMDCQLGQSCRASHAVEPFVPVLKVARVESVEAAVVRDQQPELQSIPSGLWRPPRAV